jgi:hypothetical protein
MYLFYYEREREGEREREREGEGETICRRETRRYTQIHR